MRSALGRCARLLLVALVVCSAGAPQAVAATGSLAEPARTVQELSELRTAHSRTYERTDGSRRVEVSAQPLNFRDGGAWKEIDNTLVRNADGSLRNAANAIDVRLPASLDDGEVRVARGEQFLAFALVGARAGAPTTRGPRARYTAFSGVDVIYEPQAGGVKEVLELQNAQARRDFSFALKASSGLHLRERASGAVEAIDAAGDVRFSIAAPWMVDAKGIASTAAKYELTGSENQQTLRLTLDDKWLDDPDRAWPVSADPTVYLDPTAMCELVSGASANVSACQGANGTATVGRDATGKVHRVIAKYPSLPTQIPADAVITSGETAFFFSGQSAAVDRQWDLHELTRDFTSAATWNKYDGTNAWTTAGGDVTSSRETRRTLLASWVNGWAGLGASRLIQGWTDGTLQQKGVLIKAADESITHTVQLQNYIVKLDYIQRTGTLPQYTIDSTQLYDRGGIGVNVATGNLTVSANDVQIAGRGRNLSVGRAFNSRGYYAVEQFGRNWFSTTADDIKLNKNFVEGSYYFEGPGGLLDRFWKRPDGTFLSPPGIDATLKENGDGTAHLTWNRSGEVWKFSTGDTKSLTEIADRNGNTITFTDGVNGTSKITDTQGRDLTYSYTSGQLTKLTDSTGREWNYGYSTVAGQSDYLTSVTDPEGKQTLYRYDSVGNLDQITDPRGNKTEFAYDSLSRVTSVKRVVDGTATNDVTTTYAYSASSAPCPAGTLTKTVATDPRSKQTTYCSDAQGRVLLVRDALGNDRSTTYTPFGNATTVTKLPGTTNPSTTTLSYDFSNSNPTADNTFNLLGSTGPLGETTSYEYYAPSSDPLQRYRVKRFVDEQGTDEHFGYDTNGNLTDVKDDATTPRNRATLTWNTTGTARGTIASSTDGEGRTTNYAYNAQGNLQTITPPAAGTVLGAQLGTTSYTYDGLSRVATVTDGKSQVRTLTYDKLDRVTRLDLSGGGWATFTYDNNGNLTQRQDSLGNTTSYVYDKLNRRTSETFPGAKTNTYTYDKTSNLSTIVDGGGTVTYAYDDVGRVSSIVSPKPGGGTDTVSYTRNDTASPRTETKTLPGGITERIDTDLAGKPTIIEVKNGGTTLRKQSYAYNELSPAKQTNLVQRRTDQAGNVTTYTYKDSTEDIGHLLKARTETSGGALVEEFRYTYDKANNRKTRARQTTGGTTTTTYQHNNNNQLCWVYTGTSSNGCGTAPSGATSYAYDANGNQTTGSNAYDVLDRVTTLAGTSAGYLSPTNAELVSYGSTTFQNNALGLGRLTTGGTTTEVVRDPGGAPVSQRTSASKQFFLHDRLGSTTSLADNAGTITRDYAYDPDGNATSTGSGATTDLRYAGGHLVGGLYHYGDRYYDPNTMRWTQQDPLNQITDLDEANRYAYVGGDPVNSIDPSGREVSSGESAACSTASGVVGGVAGALTAGITGSIAGGAFAAGCTLGADDD